MFDCVQGNCLLIIQYLRLAAPIRVYFGANLFIFNSSTSITYFEGFTLILNYKIYC